MPTMSREISFMRILNSFSPRAAYCQQFFQPFPVPTQQADGDQ
jgi:hypothetical protein